MIRQGSRMVLGMRDCFMCGERGTVPSYGPCKQCKGSGRGPKGGRGGCKVCMGMGRSHDWDKMVPCDNCKGKPFAADGGGVPETWCDYLPDDVFPSLPFKVYRGCRPTVGEMLMGLGDGCVYYCGDYGACLNADDAKLIEDVRTSTHGVQASKLCDDSGELPDHIGIFVGHSGYSVKAVRSVAAAVPTEFGIALA